MAIKTSKLVILGHAVGSETGGTTGELGNQTGKELRFQPWYNRSKGWTHVLRAKDENYRKKIAQNASEAVNNLCIGYDQKRRTTMYAAAEAVKWVISKIKKLCATDCSALASVCTNAAGIKVSKDLWSGNIVAVYKKTGQFDILTDSKYLNRADNLEEGDILVGPGHVAIVTDAKLVYSIDRELRYVKGSLMTGADVKYIQTKLSAYGLDLGNIDGVFGMKTEAAVRTYQRVNGLTADGIVGRKTLMSMGISYGG